MAASAASSAARDWPAHAAGPGLEDWRRSCGRPPVSRHKHRFCASYPDVSQCRRGAACAFAHSREEARTPLLTLEQEQQVPSALTEEFFMYQFKTLWCPIGVQHDWQTCVYAHNYQDARRKVSIGYGPRPCPFWAKKEPSAEYSQRCPLGLRCPFAHGAKEQLYHPQYFRTVICRDLRAKACPREKLCAFFHKRAERRKPPADTTDYGRPLKDEALPEAWVMDFLSPPFRDAAAAGSAGSAGDFGAAAFWWALSQGAPGLAEAGAFDDSGTQGTLAGAFVGTDFSDLALRLPIGPPKAEENEAEGTPRTQTGSDPADDSSTSTSRGAAGQPERAPGAGVVGLHGQPADSPWKVQAPTYGPFGGPFDAFPGFLASAGHASPWWNPPMPTRI